MSRVTLDVDQREAVGHRDGPCLVLAGPGSGKTRVIVERFLALLEAGVAPHRQLVLTYTVKAAAEMRQRAEAACGPFDTEAPLTNFHSFARRVLREWGWLEKVPPGFRVGEYAERWLHLDAVLEQLQPPTLWNPLRPHDTVDALLKLFEKAKQELVTPEDYAFWAAQRLSECDDEAPRTLLQRHQECAQVYAAYDERLRRHAVLDHDDCILLAWRILERHPAARQAVCHGLDYIMVDEYQDTNYAQARLVETLVGERGNVLVVADDDQAIYKFRGASRANIERFRRLYPHCRTITLRHNYRSTDTIVTACRAVMAAAPEATRIPKDVVAHRRGGRQVEVWLAPDERSEVMAVARECARLLETGTPPRDIAWLFRRHADMPAAMTALRECGVPYQVHGGRGYFQQPEVKDALALMTAIVDPDDSQALVRCLHLPAWEVSNAGRLAVVRSCRDDPTPLHTRLLRGTVPGLDDADADAGRRLAATVLDLHGLAQSGDCREVLFEALERSGFLGILGRRRPVERIQAGANLNKLADLLEAFADWSHDLRLGAALRYLEILRDCGEADEVAPVDPAVDGVSLLTAHSAKGLEWPIVVVAACVDSRWPGTGGFPPTLPLPDELIPEPAPPGDKTVDEERRIFYVAATRAADRLVLTRARRYPYSWRDETPSRFLVALSGATDAVEQRQLEYVPPPATRRPRAPIAPVPPHLEVGVRDLRDFDECPRRYEYARRYHMPLRPSAQRWYGTLVHEVLERAGRLRCAGEDVDAPRLVALWHQAWETSSGPRGAHPNLRDHGAASLERYGNSPAWQGAALTGVEVAFGFAVGDAVIRGRFDRLDCGSDGVPVVVDYKTGPVRSPEGARRDLQVRAYAVALAQRHRAHRVSVELHHLQTAEVVRVDLDAAALRRAEGQLSHLAAELRDAWEAGEFPPRPHAWRCRRCDFRTVCAERAA